MNESWPHDCSLNKASSKQLSWYVGFSLMEKKLEFHTVVRTKEKVVRLDEAVALYTLSML